MSSLMKAQGPFFGNRLCSIVLSSLPSGSKNDIGALPGIVFLRMTRQAPCWMYRLWPVGEYIVDLCRTADLSGSMQWVFLASGFDRLIALPLV
jgi:hypothetical protein